MVAETDVADLDAHLRTVATAFKFGEVVPFLGAGANLMDRPADFVFDPTRPERLPSSTELAHYLADLYELELAAGERDDLLRVAEWITLEHGEASFYRRLEHLFDKDYPVSPLHQLLAALPGIGRQQGWRPLEMVVTTNYDDVLERAFRAAGVEHDVLTYMAAGLRDVEEGRFLHVPWEAEPRFIQPGTANEYTFDLAADGQTLARPLILKLHGAVDRARKRMHSYVISEDDYIDFLARMDVEKLLPASVRMLLQEKSMLFLGYSLRDWNVRGMMYEIWSLRRMSVQSWAVQAHPGKLERKLWDARGIKIIATSLDVYVRELAARLQAGGTGHGAAG